MREKLLIGAIVIALVLISTFLVAAFVMNNGIIDESEKSPEKQEGLKLFPLATLTEDEEGDENEKDEQEVPIMGTELEKASEIALTYIGEGRVTDTEIGDEEGYYEVEITLNNGNEVDVHLDKDFKVLNTEYEDEKDVD